jgi:RNA polymerase sigma-70 factor (ECF subfamily)
MNADQARDEWLMAETGLGKRESLEVLIRRYASSLLTFVERMVGDRHRSEEILQDIFLAVWKKRKQYQFPRPFKAWLYAIAANHCRTSFRGRPRLLVSLEDDAAPVAVGAGDSPVEAAISTETAALVEHAVTQLPPVQRAVVVLRVWDGLSYAEIAEILERRETTVRSSMAHGLNALRKHLEHRLG